MRCGRFVRKRTPTAGLGRRRGGFVRKRTPTAGLGGAAVGSSDGLPRDEALNNQLAGDAVRSI